MHRRLSDFVHTRTGLSEALAAVFDMELRGGARWAYVFGTTLTALLLTQAITGAAMLSVYVPSTHDAWSSVFWIQERVTMGWFVRGLHRYGAHATVLVTACHLLQVAIYGAYKNPREINFWIGALLLLCVVVMADTGYQLPWDQKGYWAAAVASGIAGSVPFLGPTLQTLFLGGDHVGQPTLSRVFALHVLAIPALIAALLALHIALFRRHGPTPPAGADLRTIDRYAPKQAARDIAFTALVFLAIAATTASFPAPLDAPADPTVDYPARPEWYFLWLSFLMGLLPSSLEFLASAVLPIAVGAFLFALPLLDRTPGLRLRGRLVFVAPLAVGLVSVASLTALSLRADAKNAAFVRARVDADRRAERAHHLAKSKGIPPEGPLELLRGDPSTYGRDRYARHCAPCHVLGDQGERHAPDHTGFGSRAWILGVLRDSDAPHYFGETKLDGMPSQTRLGQDALLAITEHLYAQGREPQDADHIDEGLANRGAQLFSSRCMGCHTFRGDGDFDGLGGPDLTGYASRWWIHEMMRAPEHTYATGNEMPSFERDLDAHELRMIAAFLRGQRTGSRGFSASPSERTRH